jgi:hypothetical protein
MTGRTYRVPNKVLESIRSGLQEYAAAGVRTGDAETVNFARYVASGRPVDFGVASRIYEFFTAEGVDPSERERLSGLHGGDTGMAWAKKCMAAAGIIAAAAAAVDVEDDEPSDWDYDPEEMWAAMMPTEEDLIALLEYGEEYFPEPEDVAVEAAEGEPVAGPVASEAEEEALPGVEVFASDEIEEAEEAALALAALEEVGAAAPAAPAGGGTGPGGGLREGARVRSSTGEFGWVKELNDGGSAVVVVFDDGSEAATGPQDVTVVAVAGRGTLPPNPTVLSDPGGRLEAYQEWAQEQLVRTVNL